jgi:hypothetical protein
MTVKTNSYNLAICADGDTRIIRSNGIPEHGVGEFPNRGNPNATSPQSHAYRVPMTPVAATGRCRCSAG